MAARKPKIGGPLGDDFVKMLEKALRQGMKKVRQQQRVVNKLEKRGSIAKSNSEYIMKSRYPKTGGNSKYSRDFPEESKLYRDFVKQGKAKNAAIAKKKASARAEEAKAAKQANDARIIKGQSRTVNIQQLGEAAGRKGSKIRGGKEVQMSQAEIRRAQRQAAQAGAQRKAGNAKLAGQQQSLRNQIKAEKDATKRLQLRRKLRAHIDKHGPFN